MSEGPTPSTTRRGFLATSAAGAAIAALGTLPAFPGLAAQQGTPQVDQAQGWLRPIRSKYRQFFDTPRMDNAIPLLHVNNYLGTWRAQPGVKHDDVHAVLGIFGFAVPVVFGDAMWSKYQLGKALGLTDTATGQPYVRNPYLAPQNGELLASPDAAIPALQRNGATVILCNNAFGFWVGRIAQGSGAAPDAVRAEMLANLAPGVTLVPAMVMAVEQAQRYGLTYMKNM
jgi:hypothetical protein